MVAVVVALAGLLLALSWWGAAEEVRLARQLRWVAGGVMSIVVLGVVSATWILEGRRAGSRRRRRWMAEQRRRLAAPPVTAAPTLVAGERMTRYHRVGCELVAGKAASAASRLEHERQGRRPCGVCRPEAVEPADPEPSREAVRA